MSNALYHKNFPPSSLVFFRKAGYNTDNSNRERTREVFSHE